MTDPIGKNQLMVLMYSGAAGIAGNGISEVAATHIASIAAKKRLATVSRA